VDRAGDEDEGRRVGEALEAGHERADAAHHLVVDEEEVEAALAQELHRRVRRRREDDRVPVRLELDAPGIPKSDVRGDEDDGGNGGKNLTWRASAPKEKVRYRCNY